MNMISVIRLSLIFSIFLILVSGCGKDSDDDEIVLRLAHVLDTTHPVHKGMDFMGKRLEELSDGTMRVQIYPNAVLGGERENVEHIQLGALDITKVSGAVIENFIAEMEVFSIPYLFENQEHYWKAFDGEIGREILSLGEEFDLKGLCYYDAGFRSFLLRDKAVHSPEDLEGLTIRVMRSPLQLQTVSALGGSPTPMAFGEVYSAIQQGVVDGADGNPPTLYATRLHEVSDYYVLDEHSSPPDVMYMGMSTWNRLNNEQREFLMQAVEESVEYQKKIWNEAVEDALTSMEDEGTTIIRPEKQPFREAVSSIYDDLQGTELEPLVRRVQQLVE